MLKRPRGVDSSPVEQRSKRRHVSFPQTPVASASYSTPTKTPYTPYPLRASDSPSNPFGRKRTQRLIHTLPAETSFSKHLALRFQFVRRGVGPKQGGVYRVVQVPQSYTFTHLRCLIAFLFGVRSRGSGLEEDEHLFEIKKKVALYSARHKPGQIKVGKTWAKLSSVQDPCRWRSMYGRDALEDDEDEEEVDENEEAEVELEEDEGGEWKWEDEEVLTVAHAWPEGVDTERGIIYHHSRTTQVHITINTTTIPRRKGISNLPFVFTARGRVHLSPIPLPPPNFAPLLKSKSKQTTRKPKKAPVKPVSRRVSSSKLSRESRRTLAAIEADGDSDSEFESSRPFDKNHPFVTSTYDDEIASETEEEEDDSDGEEDMDAALNPNKWNDPEDAFEQYLTWFMGPPPATEEDSTEEDDKENSNTSMMSTPGLSLSSSPGIPSSTFSSPFRSSSPSSPAFSLYSPSSFPLSDHYPNTKYKYTPAPPKAKVARMRIERVQKRMEKAKRDKWLCARDESPEVKGVEVDELLDDDEEDDFGDDGKWVKPVLKPGEVWDPFGDEPEI